MKSLILAFVFFGLLVYGCHDVVPFKPLKRVLRRTPRRAPQPPVAEAPPPREPAIPAGRRRFRQ